MQAAKILGKHTVQLIDCPKPVPGQGEVLIKVIASGICGTDLHMFAGQSMGSYPIIPGHEFAGIVEAVGSGVQRITVGERVAVEPNLSCGNCSECLENRQHLCRHWQALGVTLPGGMAEYTIAPEYAVFSLGSLNCETGAFVEPVSCVLHGVERLQPSMGDRILLLGAGPIGLIMMRLLKIAGCSQIDVVETDLGRLQKAQQEQCGDCYASLDTVVPSGYDAVVDATGVPAVEQASLRFARSGGSILFFGVPPEGVTFPLEPYQLFRRELKLLSSFTSLRNSLQVVRLLESGQLQVSDLISHRLPLHRLEEAFTMILQKKEPVMKVMITPF